MYGTICKFTLLDASLTDPADINACINACPPAGHYRPTEMRLSRSLQLGHAPCEADRLAGSLRAAIVVDSVLEPSHGPDSGRAAC